LPRLRLGPGSSTPCVSQIQKLQVSSMFLVLPRKPAATTVARNWVDLQSVSNAPWESHFAA
jgi:hypothetical protein